LARLCAKTVAVHIYENDDISLGTETMINIDPEKEISTTVEGLKPCTKYNVALDLFMKTLDDNHSEQEDFLAEHLTSFFTMPDGEDLKSETFYNYNEDDKVLTWDFDPFFNQDCANEEDVSTQFTLDVNGEIVPINEKGSQVLGKGEECDFFVELKVEYSKEGWNKKVTTFNGTIAGTNMIEDSLQLVDGSIIKTVNPCILVEDSVEAIPLTRRARSGLDSTEEMIITFPGQLASPQPVSEVKWEGCSDHVLRMTREGRIVAELNMEHPGWANVLPMIEEDGKTNTTITFKQPEDGCDPAKFNIEIVCNVTDTEDAVVMVVGSGGDEEGSGFADNVTSLTESTNEVSGTFDFGDELTISGLTPETEYECQGRVVNKEDGMGSVWTPSVFVITDREEIVDYIADDDLNQDSNVSDPILELLKLEPELEPEPEPTPEPEPVLVVEAEMEKSAVETSNAAVVPSGQEATKSEETQEEADSTGLIIGLVVGGILIVLVAVIVVFWRKRSNEKNYQVEGATLVENKTDHVKIEMNNSMTDQSDPEIITSDTHNNGEIVNAKEAEPAVALAKENDVKEDLSKNETTVTNSLKPDPEMNTVPDNNASDITNASTTEAEINSPPKEL